MDYRFNLGSEVKDKITGFKGIVRGRSDYLTGCNTYGIQSQSLSKNGLPTEWKWLDEEQLVLLKDKKITLIEQSKKKVKKGGPISIDQYPPS